MRNTVTQKILLWVILTLLIFILLPGLLLTGRYGETLFYLLPFGIGMLYALLCSLHKRQRFGQMLKYAFIVILFMILSSVFIAKEGVICILIIGAIMMIPFSFGVGVGYIIQDKIWANQASLILCGFILLTSFQDPPTYHRVNIITDEKVMNQSATKLWQQLMQPVNFGVSDNFFFSNGVSHPLSMQVQTENNKRYLFCTYNNGIIKAPIQDWDEGKSFSFVVGDSLVSMQEKNLYRESRTMHIQNHFNVNYGKFEIIPINEHQCKLITSTAYKHKFKPEWYTDWWVAYFVHRLHGHVMNGLAGQ